MLKKLYGAAVFFGFSYLDDNTLILDNYETISHASQVGSFFTNDVFFSNNDFYYRPLLSVSLFLDTLVSGKAPWFFHFMNIIWHILAASLLFTFLKKLKTPPFISFFLSLLFLVHPALVQAVAWIPGRNDSLLAVFVLAAFIYFLNFLKTPRLSSYIASLFFFLLALFTKETAIVLPILVSFYYLFIEDKKMSLADKWAFIIGTLAAILIWGIFRSLAVNSQTSLFIIFSSFLNNSSALIVGLGRFFMPFDLAQMSVLADAHLLWGLLAVAILIAASWYKKGVSKKYLTLGLLWFVLFFLPSLINPEPTALYYFLEHRLYLPFIGLLIIVAQMKFWSTLDWRRPQVYLPLICSLIIFAAISAFHLPDFQNRLRFWQAAVVSSPQAPLPWRNLGVILYFDGRYSEAISAYQRALDLNPREPMAHNNIGVIYLNQGRFDEAEQEFKQELEVNPGYDKALANLNDLLILKNRLR